jgi:putative FmdB family regulatory protein
VPTYQYACTACDHSFEQFQSFSDDALTVCPQCEGRLRKVYNAVGVVFKGSGFYRTDSRSDAKTGAAATSGSDAATGTTGDSAGSGSGEGSSSASTPTSKPAASTPTSSTSAA